jgi:hypothetical protein
MTIAAVYATSLVFGVQVSGEEAGAQILTFTYADEKTQAGFHYAVTLGLRPPTFPDEDIAKIASPTERGEVKVKGKTYKIFGKDDDSPPRWATSSRDRGKVVYLALMPKPEPALAWYEKYQKDNNTPANFGANDWMYALVIKDGDDRHIYRLYDKIPDDKTLSAAMSDAVEGKIARIAVYNMESSDTKFD